MSSDKLSIMNDQSHDCYWIIIVQVMETICLFTGIENIILIGLS